MESQKNYWYKYNQFEKMKNKKHVTIYNLTKNICDSKMKQLTTSAKLQTLSVIWYLGIYKRSD